MSYPKIMHHPSAVKSRIQTVKMGSAADHFGTPDRLPPVTVNNPDQEAEHRAKGYVLSTDKLSTLVYRDYPVWMVRGDGAEALAKDESEETKLAADGYERKGTGDAAAAERAIAAPYDPEFEADEYPKMVDGVLVQDPAKDNAASTLYPMYVGDKLVYSEAEERAARGGLIHRDGKLIGESPEPEAPVTDSRLTALKMLATLKGVEISDNATAEEIERMLYPAPATIEEPASEGDERAALIAEAEGKGVRVDKRWNTDKIRNAIATAA